MPENEVPTPNLNQAMQEFNAAFASLHADGDYLFPDEGDLLPHSDLPSVMAQFDPVYMRDIEIIERTMENFKAFNNSHLALPRVKDMHYLSLGDIIYLEEKRAIAVCPYLEITSDERFALRLALIRSAKADGETVRTAKNSCLRNSAAVLVLWIERKSDEEKKRTLDALIQKAYSQKSPPEASFIESLNLFSIESKFEKIENYRFIQPFLKRLLFFLSFSSTAVASELAQCADVKEEAITYLKRRKGYPLLTAYTDTFHMEEPDYESIVRLDEGVFHDRESPPEVLYKHFVNTGATLLRKLDPSVFGNNISSEEVYQELKPRKPALTFVNNVDLYLEIFGKLIKIIDSLVMRREDAALDLLLDDLSVRLNEGTDIFILNEDSFHLKDSTLSYFQSPQLVREKLIQKIKTNPQCITRDARKLSSSSTGLAIMLRSRIPDIFERRDELRTFLHQSLIESGTVNGIYSLIKPDSSREFLASIEAWENERMNSVVLPLPADPLTKFIDWIIKIILSIFSPQTSRDQKDQTGKGTKPYIAQRKGQGRPRSVKIRIPEKLQAMIDAVEARNDGIIWLDEVAREVKGTAFEKKDLGDFFYQDEQNRYKEILPLLHVRRAFVRSENHKNNSWRKALIEKMQSKGELNKATATLIEYYSSEGSG